MLNTVFRLVEPRRFEMIFHNIDLCSEKVIVKPTHLSICNAEQRYYQGIRPAAILSEKLPMVLIHEGIGKVVYDATGEYKVGDMVVMVPNAPIKTDEFIAENYLQSSKFSASSCDGFMQENISINRNRLVNLPKDIDYCVASFTELVSVSIHALQRFDKMAHGRRDVIGIWGDGNLGYITAVLTKLLFPNIMLYVFGADEKKLEMFTFADETFCVNNMPKNVNVNHAIECVGGMASQNAIEHMIDCISPEGTISLLGVSEYPILINTRMILEKGLKLFGSSRSGLIDFQRTITIYEKNPEVLGYLNNLVGEKVNVCSVEDMRRAFEVDQKKEWGKTIMEWNI